MARPYLAGMNGSPSEMLTEFFPKSQMKATNESTQNILLHADFVLVNVQTTPGENVDEGARTAAKIYIMKRCNQFSSEYIQSMYNCEVKHHKRRKDIHSKPEPILDYLNKAYFLHK